MGWGAMPQTTVRPALIIIQSPLFYHVLSLATIDKYVPVETFRAKSAVKTFDKRIFPGTAVGDVQRLTAVISLPFVGA